MPSVVEIDEWPLWSPAAEAGGHWPWPPAWMCIACGAPSSRSLVLIVTVAELPSSLMSARPSAVILFFGIGVRVPGKLSPEAVVAVFEPVEAELLSSEPPLSATPATTAPATSTTARMGTHAWRDSQERSRGAAAAAATGTGG